MVDGGNLQLAIYLQIAGTGVLDSTALAAIVTNSSDNIENDLGNKAAKNNVKSINFSLDGRNNRVADKLKGHHL